MLGVEAIYVKAKSHFIEPFRINLPMTTTRTKKKKLEIVEMENLNEVQDDQEHPKHQCKLCLKTFANGKVLGGHMRSHRRRNIPAKKRKSPPIAAAAYSLRENPKKSWKFSAAPNPQTPFQENLCKICGKSFDSSKALFGHLRHHSGKRKEPIKDLELPRKKRSTRTRCKLGSSNSSDLVQFSPIEPDVHELAISLLMLSNGLPPFGAESPLIGSSTHLRVCAEAEFGMPKLVENDESEMGFGGNVGKSLRKCGIGDLGVCGKEQEVGNYECDVCLKVFGSGQALGGHKRAHVLKPNLMEIDQGNGNGDHDHDDHDEVVEVDEEEFKPWWNHGDDGDDDHNGGLQLVGGFLSSN